MILWTLRGYTDPEGEFEGGHDLVLHYKSDLLRRRKATGTTARHLSVVKSLAKYARMTGLITWAIEVTSPRIERTRVRTRTAAGTKIVLYNAVERSDAAIAHRLYQSAQTAGHHAV